MGIDLGTTNSLAAVMDLTGPRIIPGEDGERLVPSVVSIGAAGEIVVGNPARELLLTHPERTVYSVKRLMGRGVADIADELRLFPFHIAESSQSVIHLELGGKAYTPPEISAFHPAAAQAERGGGPGPGCPARGDHRAGVLQRRAAPGHPRRGAAGGAGGGAAGE